MLAIHRRSEQTGEKIDAGSSTFFSTASLESVAVTPDLSPQEPSLTDPPRMETRLEAARTEQGLRQRPQRGGDEPVEQRGKKERKLPTTAYGTTAVGAKGTRRLH
ncbi:hypothetical protein YC2023_031492 [Brassica napus]